MAPDTPRGIQHQASALEREQFDFVLLDVRMPEIDGIEATAFIRHLMRAAHSLKGG